MKSLEALLQDSGINPLDDLPCSFLPEPEPLELWCPVISVDDHVLEPATLFDRVPARHRDVAPKLVHDDLGRPFWTVGATRMPIVGGNGASGRPMAEWNRGAMRFEDMRRAVWDPVERLKDMDLDGVWAAVNFPSITWGFAGTQLSKMADREAALACVRAYNDWMLEDWCGVSPDRFIPCQIPFLVDPVLAAEEIRANAARGFRGVSFSESPAGLGLPGIYGDHWDPFFAACEATGTVVNLHVGSSGNVQRPSDESPMPVMSALFPLNAQQTAVDWLFARVPLKFPGLKIVLSEGGASWVPMIIERLRRAHRQREATPEAWLETDGDPVEVLLRNFYFASVEDPFAFRSLDLIGDDRIMLETDYPHNDSTWPTTQALVEAELAHLSNAQIRKVCFENACRVFDHPLPPAELVAGAAFNRTNPADA